MASLLLYHELEPAPAVRSHVARYWAFEVSPEHPDPVLHAPPPDGCVSLVHGGTGSAKWQVVVGPRVAPIQVMVQPGASYWGVRFWPGAGGSLLGCTAASLRDQLLPSEQLRAPAISELERCLRSSESFADAADVFNHLLPEMINQAAALDLEVMQTVFVLLHLGGQCRIRDLAGTAALSERQLQRRFRAAVGLTAKELARIARARSAATKLLDATRPEWSALAAEAGYFDQSHLTRDFAQILGRTPAALHSWMETIDHRNVK